MELAQDVIWMRRAMKLEEKGWGRTRPNPLVGCVIVRDGLVLSEGYHAALGQAHAERAAIEYAQGRGIDLAGPRSMSISSHAPFGHAPAAT
jgi:diaminohydroxyphosphoribosylaminopyrimidine deaminase/5-amino-6-(5-phosphoribosylamino)uracil reductase